MNDDGTATGYTLRLSDAERVRYRMMASVAAEDEAELWRAAGVVAGASVADVGCGPGATLVELARRVGPSGRATGVEPGPAARAAAREELDGAGFAAVPVLDGTADTTGLDESAWDCAMVRHVLAHLPGDGPDRVAAHLATRVRPGGHVYMVDTDLDAFRTVPVDPGLDAQQERYAQFHRMLGNDPRIGPRLAVLLAQAGLDVVERIGRWMAVPAAMMRGRGPLQAAAPAMITAGAATAAETARWQVEQERFADTPGAVVWLPLFIAVGRRPA